MPKESKHKGGSLIAPIGGKRNLIQPSVGNELVSAINALKRLTVELAPVTVPRVLYSDSNVVIQIPETLSTAAGSAILQGTITAIAQDTITVAVGVSPLDVAKPPHLRGSLTGETEWGVTWTYSYTGSDYQKRTRAATGLAATKQRVNLPYRIGDQITVLRTNSTGLTGVQFIDLNLASREWWTETQGCDPETGAPLYAFIPRGPWVDTAVGSNFD